MKNIINAKKGQVMVFAIIIAVTVALTTSYFILHALFKETNPGQTLGNYESSIVDALIDGDKIQVYVDEASKMSVTNAFDDYLYGNPKSSINGDISSDEILYCGSYVYRLWNSKNNDCYPDYNSASFELNSLINNRMANLTYLQQSTGYDKYLDSLLKQKIVYDYTYIPGTMFTTVYGHTDKSYTIFAFKDGTVRNNENILTYVDAKATYGGAGGDIAGVPFVNPAPDNFLVSNGRTIKYVVIHYTAGYSISDAMSRFATPGEKASAHYIVGGAKDDFKVVQAVSDKDVAYHAGCNREDYGCSKEEYKTINTNSIGIEIVNSGYLCDSVKSCRTNQEKALCVDNYIIDGTDKQGTGKIQCWEKYPNEQYDKVVALTALLVKKYNIPVTRDNIIGHVEVVLTGKVDPGPAFDLDKFVTDVRAAAALDEAQLAGQVGVASNQDCLKSDSTDWNIHNVELSSKSLTSDQTLKITMGIENKGDSCVTITPTLFFNTQDDALKTIFRIDGKINVVHKSTVLAPYTTIQIICTFTNDVDLALKEQGLGNCVLWTSDSKDVKYSMAAQATDYNNKIQDYKINAQNLEFAVQKGTINNNAANTNTNNNPPTILQEITSNQPLVQLSKSEQTKRDKTQSNLESLNLMDYITEVAKKYDVRRELILGIITQESTGDMHADSKYAYGLMQVTKDTFDGTKFDNKCTWEEYKNDAECQVRAGTAVLRNMYDALKGRTIYYSCNVNCRGLGGSKNTDGYWSTCSNGCSPKDCIGPYSAQYDGWDAALRKYNGGGDYSPPKSGSQSSGCVQMPDYTYVEKIMRFAASWGYSDAADKTVKEELNAGILGKYDIKPTFNVKLNFDLRLLDMLKKFASETVIACGKNGIDRNACIQEHISDFNNSLSQEYKDNGVVLSTSCDTSANMAAVNTLVEDINNCMASPEDICKCTLTGSDIRIQSVQSVEGSTTLKYDSNNEMTNSYFDYTVKNYTNNKLWSDTSVKINDIKLYKNGTRLVLGTVDNPCSATKSTYRMCLNTNYKYVVYNKNAGDDATITSKYVVIPFAITVRDSTPPAQISGLNLDVMPHAKNSIILKWNKGAEDDIVKYNIYLSDNVDNILQGQTKNFKSTNTIKYIYVNSQKSSDYLEYYDIDFSSLKCDIKDAGDAQYCVFKYDATDKDRKTVTIELEKEKLYYINSKKQFVYVLNGSNPSNGLVSGQDKTVAVTAVDIDGNEINNIDDKQQFVTGTNLITVKPEDKLEGALTKITSAELTNENKKLILSWNPVNIYIDGTLITPPDNDQLKYKVYFGPGTCTDGIMVAVNTFGTTLGTYTDTQRDMDVSANTLNGDSGYCIGVGTIRDGGQEYSDVTAKYVNSVAISPAP